MMSSSVQFREFNIDASIRHNHSQPDIWLDEEIWGHRLYDQASPELVLLEMLNVVDSVLYQGKDPFKYGSSKDESSFTTSFRRSLILRTVLFNNSYLHTALEQFGDTAQAWAAQRKALYEAWETKYLTHPTLASFGISGPDTFGYLEERFPSFKEFVTLVDTIRRGALEMASDKRWTSRFLFPYCPEALFEDLDDKSLSADRRFFGRTGELAYLMLARSGYGKEIWNQFKDIWFARTAHGEKWRRAVVSLMHEKDRQIRGGGSDERYIGHLPYAEHPSFERFGRDVLTLLRAGMPEYDVFPYLAKLIMFHLLHYLLTVSSEGVGDQPPSDSQSRVAFVLEIQDTSASVVRRMARYTYQRNKELPSRRVQAAFHNIAQLPQVNAALTGGNLGALRSELKRWWRKADDPGKVQAQSAISLWEAFQEAVVKRHDQHLGNVHHEYARLCGLASRVGTNSYRYAPRDSFLRTLVLANVTNKEMEYDDFLDLLYHRYGFVIAKRHAEYLQLSRDLTDFDANDRRFQHRLTGLGLIYRKSDACAYVINRYR